MSRLLFPARDEKALSGLQSGRLYGVWLGVCGWGRCAYAALDLSFNGAELSVYLKVAQKGFSCR
ncbi:hypothetical protein GCM10010277_87450 [Streptomyces longisporoflavus]|nr:hypothetical protein GCM10010277_87450 [Streptomyces longisporoflavus]